MTTTERLTREVAMTAVRVARRALVAAIFAALCVPYMLGWLAGFVALVVLSTGTATRLGWQDAQKRGDSGAA